MGQRDKYCPHVLSSCLSHLNMGYNWTLQGLCVPRQSECPALVMQEVCSNMDCPPDQYLCHPKGCVPMISQCNGECPLMVATQTKNNNKTKLIISSTSTTTRATTLHNWTSTKTEETETYERRVMCGNSCLTREEAKHKYHCGGHCQGKSEPCRSKEEAICPQHYQLCGRDTCIDSFLQEKSVAASGFPEFYDCNNVCTPSSTPCVSIKNKTEHCPPGYWLCRDNTQCVLQGYHIKGTDEFISNLCDSIAHCKDGSDEEFKQCFKVYSETSGLSIIVLVVVIPLLLGFLLCLRSHLFTFLLAVFTRSGESQGKSFHRNEAEMYLRNVQPEDVD